MAEANTILNADLVRVREIDFVTMFEYNTKKLMEVLGVTRPIAKQAGAILKAYKAQGTLENGSVPEGDLIPLSKYETVPVNLGEIELKKWRKSTTVEAVTQKTYNQAVVATNQKMLEDVQKGIKQDFFTFLATGTGTAAGTDFQGLLGNIWGNLAVLFEDYEVIPVHFINPLDIGAYLGSAQITMQTAFGMRYVEDFMGMGTVITSGLIPQGKIYSTAKRNIVAYYIPVNGADINKAWTFTSDSTGLIGIHEHNDYDHMIVKNTVISGLMLFADRLDGIIVGSIGGSGNP